MTKLRIFQIDAFADAPFTGNPAAVVPLDAWLSDALLQSIALENQLSETAFLVAEPGGYALRWFTPGAEVDLCGHATLASAFVVRRHLAPELDPIVFSTRSGPLTITFDGELVQMDFPVIPSSPVDPPAALLELLGAAPDEVRANERAYMVFWNAARLVRDFQPDFAAIAALDRPFLTVTAPGEPGSDIDFVSRFFAPTVGVPEDPVTGSNHCALAPVWAQRLSRAALTAQQLSARGGSVLCRVEGDRVRLSGRCVPYLDGHIRV